MSAFSFDTKTRALCVGSFCSFQFPTTPCPMLTLTAVVTSNVVKKQLTSPLSSLIIIGGSNKRSSSIRSSSNGYQQTSPSAVHFPWRHSNDPLLRVQNKDDYSGMPNNARARFVRRLIATRELNLTFFDALRLPSILGALFGWNTRHGWEEELSANFTTAFGLAFSELLRTLFSRSSSSSTCAGFGSVSHEHPDCIILIDTSKKTKLNAHSPPPPPDGISSIENNDYLKQMIDETLLKQYLQLNLQHLQIKLSIKPIGSKIQNIFAVPMLTREVVTMKPHLKGAYQRLEAIYKDTKSYAEVKQKTYELAEEVGFDSAKRTVIAEVTISCLEFFQVKDTRTSEIVQGMKDDAAEEEVVHLVRFEAVTDRGKKKGERELSSWKIIDVDDLLEGNVFH